jgi:tryptophan synthase beta subunit
MAFSDIHANFLVNLSGRGDKDIDFVVEHHPIPAKIS